MNGIASTAMTIINVLRCLRKNLIIGLGTFQGRELTQSEAESQIGSLVVPNDASAAWVALGSTAATGSGRSPIGHLFIRFIHYGAGGLLDQFPDIPQMLL